MLNIIKFIKKSRFYIVIVSDFDYNEYIKEGMRFMLIQDDALRSVVARTLRVKEDELTEELMKDLIHLEVQDHEIKSLEGLQYARL